MKRSFLFLIPCLLLASPASAMPGAERFAAADTDGDGFLSHAEFEAAFPGLKAEAFSLIDKNGDGRIDREEWRIFRTGHGMAASAQVPTPPATSPDQGETAPPGAGEKTTPEAGTLPLLSPPAR